MPMFCDREPKCEAAALAAWLETSESSSSG